MSTAGQQQQFMSFDGYNLSAAAALAMGDGSSTEDALAAAAAGLGLNGTDDAPSEFDLSPHKMESYRMVVRY